MSAIFGVVRTDGQNVSEREIGRMANILAHRGPDGRHIAVHDNVGLGHCLMRIVQEDWHEAQPIREAGITLVADLRLDNREALAGQLGIDDAVLRDMADSALLLAAYRHWGAACVDHLLGDFVFAIWDGVARTLTLARDHMGQRGLYYHHGDGFLVFASEAKALWAVEGVPRKLSEEAIARRLLFPVDHIPGATQFEGIEGLPGATVLQLHINGSLTTRSYWQPHADPAHLGHDDAYYIAAYRRILGEAVACRVRRATRAPALLLSGGFDSGNIAALAGPIVAAQGRRIVAVTSVLGEGQTSPQRDARDAADAFRTYPWIDLHHYTRGQDHMFGDIETSFLATDDSMGTPYVRLGLYRLAAANGARLVLDGMGGDYTVNVRGPAMLGRMLLRGKLIGFAREFRARRRATGRRFSNMLREDVMPALTPLKLSAAFAFVRRGGVRFWHSRPVQTDFARAMFDRAVIDPSRLRMPRSVHDRWEARWMNFLRNAMGMLPVQPTLAASEGLDFTRPYHDRRVVEFGLAIPERLHVKNGLERYVARQAMADILPERLLRSGPGNDSDDPEQFAMLQQNTPAALAAVREADRDGRLTRYIDFEKLATMVAASEKSGPAERRNLYVAARIVALARFIAWFENRN